MQEILENLLRGQRLAVLATSEAGGPYTSLIAFAATEDLQEIIFATARATRKFANLTAAPKVSLLIDDRSNRETDFGQASAVTVLGTAAEALGPGRERLLPLFLHKHPSLEEFVTAPTCALIRVRVEKYLLVTRFQEVREIIPSP